MKFQARIEHQGKRHHIFFDVEDEATAQEQLATALAEIQREFVQKVERPVRAASPARSAAPPGPQAASAGGAK